MTDAQATWNNFKIHPRQENQTGTTWPTAAAPPPCRLMHFLAHAYLSFDDPGLITGNLVADFLRGRAVLEELPPEVLKGVMLHRLIDRTTDEHPVTRATIARIKPRWGRYSPIIVDLFYDHILARDWEQYSDTPLREFADRTYDVIRHPDNDSLPGVEWVLKIVVNCDRFPTYATVEGIEDALARISKHRLKRDPGLGNAAEDLRALDEEITADFHDFFPDIVRVSEEWIRDNGNGA